MTSKSRRERLIAIAKKLGVEFRPSISDNDLALLIKQQPATPKQREIIGDFLKSQGNRALPAGITFGKAGQIIQEMMEILNERAINELRLSAGDVVHWRGAYFYVMNIGSVRDRYRLTLQQVGVWRAPGSNKAQFASSTRKPFRANPVTLRYDQASIVDLAKWRLSSSAATSVFDYEDEPPF